MGDGNACTVEQLMKRGADILQGAWAGLKVQTHDMAPLSRQEIRQETRLLLEWATGWGLAALLAHPEWVVDSDARGRFEDAVRRRAAFEPVAHITGRAGFYGRLFEVGPSVLIPRPDTEVLVETVLTHLAGLEPNRPIRLLDVGTGSGCIPITLLCERPNLVATSLDISGEALAVAGRNAERFGVSDRLTLLERDVLSAPDSLFSDPFDVLVSNPPYIATEEARRLMPEVVSHEPFSALDGGADGLVFYRRLVQGAGKWVKAGGLFAVEIGHDQREDVFALFKQAGFAPGFVRDVENRDRVVYTVIAKCL